MYIENGNTLVVKSDALHYEKERSGKKPNTWRYLDTDDGIQKHQFDLVNKIRVIDSAKPVCCFTRKVEDVSFFGDVVVVSWEHSNGTN